MEPIARQLRMRGIITYGVIALVLLGSVLGVVVWAKDRAKHNATNQPAPTSETVTPEVLNQEGPAPAPGTQEDQSQASNQPAATPDTSHSDTTPHQVPATGAEDWLPFVVSVSLTGFMAARYMQSRRRLLASR